MPNDGDGRIPAFVNPTAGSGERALEAIRSVGRYDVISTTPETLDESLRDAIAHGAERVAVAGGDGTVARAATVLAGTTAALAIVPGGTLNHFAKAHGVPLDHEEAARLGAEGPIASADVAYVNDRLFLNTSSVGAYVSFVRARERLERRLPYRLASLVAALRMLGRIRSFTVELEVERQVRRYRSSLVFVGVGERELQLPSLGSPVEGGRRGLHVIVVRGGTWARVVAVGFTAAFRGTRALARSSMADSFVVDRCRIEFVRPEGRVALDGELLMMRSPLEYRIARNALRIVVPRDEAEDEP